MAQPLIGDVNALNLLNRDFNNRNRFEYNDNDTNIEWHEERGHRGGSRGGNGKHSKHGKGRCDD
jgi:hypothetical protein